MVRYFVFLIILVVINRGFTLEYYHAKSSVHPHSRIKEHIFIDYDSTIRPVVNHQNATRITVRMFLKSIDYNTLTNTIDVHSWFALHWTDEHLKWDKKDFDNVDTILVSSYEIWTPDVSIYNGRDQSDDPSVLSGISCIMSNKGRVSCVPHVKSSAYCRANLLRYPYDKQNCSVILGSWAYTSEEVYYAIQSDALITDDYTPNGEWELTQFSAVKIRTLKCCPNRTHPSLRFTFLLKRHPGFHAATEVVPALVVMITTLLTTCLNPSGMDRFCLACLNVIIHMLLLQFISWFLPSFGDEVPLIIDYSRNSLVISTLALLLTAILKRLVNKSEESPMWISNMITGVLGSRIGQILFLFNYSLKASAAAKDEEDGTNIIGNGENNKHRDCLLFAKILDRVCFLIFFIVYFCMFIAFIPEV